jgi:hypothetical protein
VAFFRFVHKNDGAVRLRFEDFYVCIYPSLSSTLRRFFLFYLGLLGGSDLAPRAYYLPVVDGHIPDLPYRSFGLAITPLNSANASNCE